MSINKGYLGADLSQDGDERYTPRYAVEPLLEFATPPRKHHNSLVSI